MKKLFSIAVLAALFTSSAQGQDAAAEKVTYQDHVLPIFRAKCGSCHNGNDKKGGLVLDDYAAMMMGGSSGTVLEGGDPGASYLWSLITHADEPKMPPNADKMPDAELAVIQKWIVGGLLKDAGSKAMISDKPKLAKVEIVPGQRPAEVALPIAFLGDPTTVTSSKNAVTALACSPWAPLAAVSGHRQVAIYNTQTMLLQGVLPYPEGQPEILKFSRTGDLLLVGGGQGGALGKVVVFDVKTGTRKIEAGSEYDSVLAADISPDQTMIALGGPKKMVRVYSTATGELLYEMKKHTDWITAMEFSPDGVLLATGDRANGLIVWESSTGKIFYDLIGHKGTITDISWRPDSNVVASSSEDGNIKLWEMENGREIKNWGAHGGGAASVEYTREGQIVSTGRDLITRLWDGDGNKIRDFGGMTDLGMEVAYDAETKRVLGGDWTGTVRIWNADDAVELGQLSTSPPTYAMVVDSLNQSLAGVQASAEQAAAALAAMQKAIADKEAAAQKAIAEMNAANELATATAAAAVKADETYKAEVAALMKADELTKAALAKATADQELLNKAAEALKAAETALAAAKAAFEKAGKDRDGAMTVLAEAQKAQTAAVEAQTKSKAATEGAQKLLTDAQTAQKAAADAAVVAKAAAEKAQAEAKLNEEMMKQLQAAQSAAAAAQQQLDAMKQRVELFKQLPVPQPAAAAAPAAATAG